MNPIPMFAELPAIFSGGMILIAIGNYLTGGAIQERFHADKVAQKAEEVLMKENFFKA